MSTTISKQKITWNQANFLWNDNPYTWNDVSIVTRLVEANGKAPEYFETLSEKEQERFITILTTIKGNLELSQPHIYKERKKVNKKLKISVNDVNIVAKEVLGINLQVENIHV